MQHRVAIHWCPPYHIPPPPHHANYNVHIPCRALEQYAGQFVWEMGSLSTFLQVMPCQAKGNEAGTIPSRARLESRQDIVNQLRNSKAFAMSRFPCGCSHGGEHSVAFDHTGASCVKDMPKNLCEKRNAEICCCNERGNCSRNVSKAYTWDGGL